MEKKELNHQDVINYVGAEEVSLELGLISLTSVTNAEQLLMLRTVQDDRLFEMTTAIGVSYLDQEETVSAEDRQKSQILHRIDCLETGQPFIENSDTSHLISISDLDDYFLTKGLSKNEVSRYRNLLIYSSMHKSMFSRPFLQGLLVSKDEDMPLGTPINKRRFIDMRILEAACNNGELEKVTGIKTKRLAWTMDFIKYWKKITGRPVK
jgi:hypothetical protein